VDVAAADVRCEVSEQGSDALCEFACPICRRLILLASAEDRTRALWIAGAGRIAGAVPFEFLERHDGPRISWDDVLDFRLALASTCCPPDEAAA
jgi:hypothetical protein